MNLSTLRAISCLVPLLVALLAATTLARAQIEAEGARQAHGRAPFEVIQEGLRRNKQEMCSYLLADIGNQNEALDLDKIMYLYESALDHLARTSEYVTMLRPHVDQEVVENFDKQGSDRVLQISEARRAAIEEYQEAVRVGASDLKKQKVLERAFYKACEFKLSTVVAEEAMYKSALRAEERLKVKLLPKGSRRPAAAAGSK